MGASKVKKKSLNSDKSAFGKVRPDGVSVIAKKEFDENVVGKDSDQASSEQSSESSDVCQFSRLSQNSFSKQGTCVESNIVIILTIIFAITIKLLELFELSQASMMFLIDPPDFVTKVSVFIPARIRQFLRFPLLERNVPNIFVGN